MNAPSELEVDTRLTQMGYSASAVMLTPSNGAPAISPSQRAVTLRSLPPRTAQPPDSKLGGCRAKDLALFYRQFPALVKSGISFHQSLDNLGPRTSQPALRQTSVERLPAA